jgi:hypothetical protein
VTGRALDDEFPSVVVHPDRVVYRVHRASNDPLYFSSSGLGRFDVLGVAGLGTCYVSPSPIGAYLETLGRLGTISSEDIDDRRLTELTLARSLKLGDLTNRSVLGRYRITGDISVGTDYTSSQELAQSLYELGFDGPYYTIRHDPAFLERAMAIFGGSGEEKLFAVATTAIPDTVLDQGALEFGSLVLPPPTWT